MQALLALARLIDGFNDRFGALAKWAVILACFISAGNAFVRYGLDISSNGWLEIQWYLFAAVFLLGAGYGLLKNSHVRIDFVSAHLSPRTRNWVDVVGILAVLFPFCLISITLSWPLFTQALATGEMSQNAGGLIRWPAYGLIPLGFALLMLQGLSELIKRLAFLSGKGPDPLAGEEAKSDEQKHLEELEAAAKRKLAGES